MSAPANSIVPAYVEPFRIEDLLESAAFPHAAGQLRLKETHLSWVVLTGYYAYKIKKPVHFDFVDASTLGLRRALCEEELHLNRRFARDLYLDVVPIVREGGRLRIGGPGEAEAVEYAIRMHEFAGTQELAHQLAQRTVTPHDMSSLATYLADLHVRAAVAPAESSYGSFELTRSQMNDNFELLRGHLNNAQTRAELDGLMQWTRDGLQSLQPLIEARKRSGFVRECHGDLHIGNIVRWQQQWLPFDCLAFDPKLRWIDVMSEVAFLFMDLLAQARDDLAYQFLSGYLEQTGDYEGLRLLPVYAAYRALVRAKVDALGAEAAGLERIQALEARLTERLRIAARFQHPQTPALLLMHGVTACGKSSLSEQLVSAVPALRVRSDLERKRQAGVPATAQRSFAVNAGDYSSPATGRLYARLLECADAALAAGCNAVIDATFLRRSQRQLFRQLALRRHCRFLILTCSTDRATLDARLRTRLRTHLDPSEANQAVLEEQLKTQELLDAQEQRHAVRIDTGWLISDAAIGNIKWQLQHLQPLTSSPEAPTLL